MAWWQAHFQKEWTVSLLSDPTAWERAVDAVDADLVARDPIPLIAAARSDENAPLAWLPYLAAERSVDEFSGAWPESRQRAVVAASFATHQRKGTRRVLDTALAPFGYQVKVVEWFEHVARRTPYTFQISVTLPENEPWSAEQRRPLVRIANGAKNAHTKLEAIALRRRAPEAVAHVGAVVRRRRTLRIGQVPKAIDIRQTSHLFLGALQVRRRKLIVQPRP